MIQGTKVAIFLQVIYFYQYTPDSLCLGRPQPSLDLVILGSSGPKKPMKPVWTYILMPPNTGVWIKIFFCRIESLA